MLCSHRGLVGSTGYTEEQENWLKQKPCQPFNTKKAKTLPMADFLLAVKINTLNSGANLIFHRGSTPFKKKES